MKMIAKKRNQYGGRLRSPGEEFDVRGGDVRLVEALGWATRAPTPARVTASTTSQPTPAVEDTAAVVEARDMTAVEADEPHDDEAPNDDQETATQNADRPKRAYRRRDMTAGR